MNFNDMALYLDQINKTKKRLEIHTILCNLMCEAIKPENRPYLPQIIYILQGRVDSVLTNTKMNIAEKMVLKAIAGMSLQSEEKIAETMKTLGDVGDVAAKYAKTMSEKKGRDTLAAFIKKSDDDVLTIPLLCHKVMQIANTTGEGSVKQKIDVIIKLFHMCNPLSAKYLAKFLVGSFSIGSGDNSIMDALAEVGLGDKKKRSLVEAKYNIYPDLGYIAKKIAENIDGINAIQITVGVPIRMMLASRVPYEQIPSKIGGFPFIAEYKYDGERLQIHKKGDKIHIFSRHLIDITDQYPDVVLIAKENIHVNECIIEGECVAIGKDASEMLPFQLVSTRRRKYDVAEASKNVPICVFVFDILYFRKDGTISDCTVFPFQDRHSILQKLLSMGKQFQIAQQTTIHSLEEMVTFFKVARTAGAEGIMMKSIREDSIYQAGKRGFNWLKMKGLEGNKMTDSVDAVIIGAQYGKGKRAGLYGAFYLAVLNPITSKFESFTKCGSGFSDDQLDMLTAKLKPTEISTKPASVESNDKCDAWFTPSIVIELVGDELTKSDKSCAGWDGTNGYSIRFPIFQRIRDDKGVNDITTSDEIIDLYNR